MNETFSETLRKLETALMAMPDAPETVDGEDPKAQEARQSRIASLTASANIPPRHWNQKVEHKDEWTEALQKARNLMQRQDGATIVLIGYRGTGKTQIATEIARGCFQSLRSVLYTTERGLMAEIRSTYTRNSEVTEKEAINSLVSPSLIIIDELKPRTAEDAWAAQMLEHIIDCRYLANKYTIMITNMDDGSFARHAGESISSRINETGGVIPCRWEGWR